ncbi:MAG: aminotransferase class I/II-fold pyridoxal phosphate-dependent enzyme [bacterium]|nr:MAG: aminotransferase class I/II-fold pyridoxal phosphate-dependent enzyme [bacterium]
MPTEWIDLRSDTVTRPSPEMREAISRAEVGDDVLGDDPTVRRLEERVAAMFGKEAAVYVPSGTMSNTLALISQTRPGNEVILDRNSHIFNYEAGAASAIGGLQLYPLDGPGGLLPLPQLHSTVRPVNVHHPQTALIAVENTHNRAGGRIYPFEELEAVSDFARECGLRVHMDGARLANASVATGIPFQKYASLADSITFCFSKGLGAPVGSILIADADTITNARFWRKRLGGGMRQVGLLAAACLYALDHNVDRLVEDHTKAARIGEIIASSGKLTLTFEVETNIIIFETASDAIDIDTLKQSLEKSGILALTFGGRFMRMVTHLDITDEDMGRLESILPSVLSSLPS